MLAERVEHGGRRVRDQQHVGLVDRLEAADRRAVEHPALGEDVRVERLHRNGEVLHGARQVREPDVNELHVFLSDEREDFFSTAEHQPSLYRARIGSYISISSSGSLRTVAVGNFRAVSPMFRQCYACSGGPARPPVRSATIRRARRGAAARARRASGYRSPVSQGSRNPRTRNATKVAAAPVRGPSNAVADDTPDYPGKRFGLPMTGPIVGGADGQAAGRADRRLGAVLPDRLEHRPAQRRSPSPTRTTRTPSWSPCCLFVVEVYLLTAISGLTVGKRLLGIRTIRTDGSRPGFKWAALRTAAAAVRHPGLPDRPRPARPARPRGRHDRRPAVAAQGASAAWASAAGGRPWASAPSASASSAAAP